MCVLFSCQLQISSFPHHMSLSTSFVQKHHDEATELSLLLAPDPYLLLFVNIIFIKTNTNNHVQSSVPKIYKTITFSRFICFAPFRPTPTLSQEYAKLQLWNNQSINQPENKGMQYQSSLSWGPGRAHRRPCLSLCLMVDHWEFLKLASYVVFSLSLVVCYAPPIGGSRPSCEPPPPDRLLARVLCSQNMVEYISTTGQQPTLWPAVLRSLSPGTLVHSPLRVAAVISVLRASQSEGAGLVPFGQWKEAV